MTHLEWDGCRNARDVGGLPTRYGGTTRAGAMIRTDTLHMLSPAGLAALAAVQPALVLDLRSDFELDELDEPHPLDGDPAYTRIPWIDPEAEALRDPDREPRLADIYCGSLDRNQRQIAAAYRAIAAAPVSAPVVVHCKSGKDRTGLLVALLLDLVGVPRDVIAADYSISEVRLEMTHRPPDLRTPPEVILTSLDHVDRRYGGVRGYLTVCGLTAVEIRRLTARLTPAQVEAVVFDFDGLLMDTETTMVESWRAEWRHHGLDLSFDGFWPGHGGDVTESRYARLAELVPGFDRDAAHARRTAYRDRLHETLDFRPGIRSWLAEARDLGLRVAIASSSPRRWVEGHLKRTNALDLFGLVVTGDEVSAHKPDPAVYLLALSRLGLPGPAAVAVEDTPHGVQAAAAAGMPTAAIPNPFVTAAEVAHADVVLTSAEALPLGELLRRLP
jgi:HAD superfamily hydrolase (TIGR01509 family)